MSTVTLADAKARLSELVERAAAGEFVCITRRGKPVARITGIATVRKPIDIAELRAATSAWPLQRESVARELVRRMRMAIAIETLYQRPYRMTALGGNRTSPARSHLTFLPSSRLMVQNSSRLCENSPFGGDR